MKEYETVFIASPELTDAQVSQINEKAKSIIEKRNGKLLYARDMGKRKLAYPIAKQTKGFYYCLDYVAPGESIAELERTFRLSEEVIRFLTVMKAEKVDVEARLAEIAARGEDAPVESQERREDKGTAAHASEAAVSENLETAAKETESEDKSSEKGGSEDEPKSE